MEALMAFISIVAIVAIVLFAGGLIAFIGHMIIGVFDNTKGTSKSKSNETLEYTQYKQLEDVKNVEFSNEYNFDAINESKAQKERAMSEKDKIDIYAIEEDKDDELEEIEQRLKSVQVEEESQPAAILPAVKEEAKQPVQEIKVEEDDDFDLDNLLDEISSDVIEEEQAQANNEIKIGEELESYSIDEMLKQAEESKEDEKVEEDEDIDVLLSKLEEEMDIEEDEKSTEVVEEASEEVIEEAVEEVKEEVVETPVDPAQEEAKKEIESLKAQLEELNKQLELAKTSKVEVVKIDTTEEECVQRLEILEERLKNVKKDYKVNLKEYKPLKKVMNDLERYQTKLRRKEAIVAKKKVALYGVNNYVDIDKEKAEKLANELELLDGLRLSVSHCEEVINANKDRFPILEHANQILEDQISHIEADILSTQETLKKIREKNGNGEGSNEGENE